MSVSPSHPQCRPSRWLGRQKRRVRSYSKSQRGPSQNILTIDSDIVFCLSDIQTEYSKVPHTRNGTFSGVVFPVSRCEVCSPHYLVLLSKQAMETHVQGVKCEDVSVWWRFPPEIFVSNGWLFTKYPSLNISINLHEFDTQKPTMPARLPASPRK